MIRLKVKRLDLSPEAVMNRRNFPTADRYLAQRLKAFCDPYVPMQTGHLKNSAEVGADYVRYAGPYAAFQYGGVVMVGVRSGSPWARRGEKKHVTSRALSYHGGGKRGARWDRRMMAERGREYREDIANYIGGKAK